MVQHRKNEEIKKIFILIQVMMPHWNHDENQWIMKSLFLFFLASFFQSIYSRYKTEYNELMEINRRQSECLKMLEDEYKKLEDDHQRLSIQYDEMNKKKHSYVRFH